MKSQRGTIQQLIAKNGLLDDREYFYGVDTRGIRRSIAIIPIVCGGFDWEYEAEEEVRSEVLKSAEGVKLRAETWREFFQQVDTSGYSKVYINTEGIAKLSHSRIKKSPMTEEQRKLEEKERSLKADHDILKGLLKLWEASHYKDAHGKWHEYESDNENEIEGDEETAYAKTCIPVSIKEGEENKNPEEEEKIGYNFAIYGDLKILVRIAQSIALPLLPMSLWMSSTLSLFAQCALEAAGLRVKPEHIHLPSINDDSTIMRHDDFVNQLINDAVNAHYNEFRWQIKKIKRIKNELDVEMGQIDFKEFDWKEK